MQIGKISDFKRQEESIVFKGIKLKPMQVAIINCLKKHHVLANLPTGFGKSMLFQFPASQLKDKTVLVFVPLKALLWDCLKQAGQLNISADQLAPAFIKKYRTNGELPQLLFLTPQRMFMNPLTYQFVEMINEESKIQFVVIDEAHCVSEWGSDFRPDYSKLCDLRQMFGNLRILGMSATMPAQSRQDLVNRLKIPNSYYFQSSSNRPNLVYQIKQCEPKQICKQILHFLKRKGLQKECGVIYCQTIKTATEVFQTLKKMKEDCCIFHSKLPERERAENFGNFMSGNIKTIVATICFGMGVNKKNIRYVINVGISLSAENYYQESGRAGRDGEVAFCLLLTFKKDDSALQFLIQKSTKKSTLFKRRMYKLNQIKQYSVSESCRKQYLFRLLGEEFSPQQCKKSCDFCIEGLSYEYTEIDFTQKGLEIAKEYAASKPVITKNQLNKVIRGVEAKIKYKGQLQKVNKMKGILPKQKQENVKLLIQKLIEMRLLSVRMKFSKYGKVQYIEAGNNKRVNQIHKVIVRVPHQKKTTQDVQEKQKDKKGWSKFDDYIKIKRAKTEPDWTLQIEEVHKLQDSFQERVKKLVAMQKSKQQKNEGFLNRQKGTIQNEKIGLLDNLQKQRIQKVNCQELDEIKIVETNLQYHSFLQDLFGEQVEAQQINQEYEQQTQNEREDRDVIIEEYQKGQLERVIFDQNEESQEKYEIILQQQLQLIKGMKKQKKQRHQKEPVHRKNLMEKNHGK